MRKETVEVCGESEGLNNSLPSAGDSVLAELGPDP